MLKLILTIIAFGKHPFVFFLIFFVYYFCCFYNKIKVGPPSPLPVPPPTSPSPTLPHTLLLHCFSAEIGRPPGGISQPWYGKCPFQGN